MTAVELLHERVLPSYDAHGVVLQRALTNHGREPLQHPVELSCTVQQIEHRTTRVGAPDSNGMVERCNRTLKEEFFGLANCRKFYESVETSQPHLDECLAFYNERRAHHGYRSQGRTPLQTFLEHQARPEDAQVA